MRNAIGFLLTLSLSGVAVAGAGPANRPTGADLHVDTADLAAAGLGVTWHMQLPLRAAESLQSLWLLDEHVYALSDRGLLLASRAESGLMHWQRSVAGPGDVVFDITHAMVTSGEGELIVTTPGWIAQFERETGKPVPYYDRATRMERERIPLDVPAVGPAVADARYLYVSLCDGRFVSIDRKTGLQTWRMGTGTSGGAAPRQLLNRVFFVSDRGRLTMFNTERSDRDVVWSGQLGTGPLESALPLSAAQRSRVWPGSATATPLDPVYLDADGLFITCEDQQVYSIDPRAGLKDGQCRWRYALGSRPTEGPAVAGGLVFQPDSGHGLVAIDREHGRRRWLLPQGQRFLARGGGMVYVLASGGALLIASEATGELRNVIPASGVRFAARNERTDAIFLGGSTGRVLCVRPRNAAPLSRASFLPVPAAPTTAAAATPTQAVDAGADVANPPAVTEPSKTSSGGSVDPLRSNRF